MPPEATPSLVRIFPDYADTVLWFNGPVHYEDSGLTAELIAALQAWELSYYEALTLELGWKSADLARQFTAEGNRLAQMLAEELGWKYEIEFASDEDGVPANRCRVPEPGRNTAAVAAFDKLVAEQCQEQQELARLRADGVIIVGGED